MSFTGKVVLVTGASSGIGAAIAIKFSEHGAKVAIVGRNEIRLKATFEKCEQCGGLPYQIVADVTKDDHVKRIVNDTIKHFGQLDVLVNNAGIGSKAPIDGEHTMQVFDEVMATNLRSAVYITNLAVPHLVKTKGNVINISSIVSTVASSTLSMLCTSKAALDHFARCAALELAPKGIRVNNVNPGPVKTDVFENMGGTEAQASAMWESWKKATPLQRIGESEEIADLVLFLASDRARSITGSCFVSDNGIALKGMPN